MAFASPEAAARTLMDILRERQGGSQASSPAPAAQPASPRQVRAPRVSGPSYYTYRPDALVRVDFSALRLATGDEADPAPVLDAAPVGATGKMRTPPPGKPAPAAASGPAQEAVPPFALDEALLAGLHDFELRAEQGAAEALLAHYAAEPELIWVDRDGINARARQALRVLGEAASHGLDARDYALAPPAAGEAGREELARFEMALSARVLRYARDAHGGRVDPNKISGYHDFAARPLDLQGVLHAARTAPDAGAVLEALHPRNAQYAALRAELEALRASAENDIVVAPGTLIRPGQSDPEFPKILALVEARADASLRAEFATLLDAHRGGDAYARELEPVIRAAQKAAGVDADGIVGARTVRALAGESRAARIEKVEIALEQLRWLPPELGARYVFLNAPSFRAAYVEDGEERLSMRAIYGSNATQTYFFQDEISYVEFHPYWGVPRSILVNTYLPRLLADPSYLDRSGFEVVNAGGRRVASSSVDWARYGANIPYNVRQTPGPRNALGEMKIMFPNRHAIYMHDTPDRHLFSRDNRALSNGCIRLEDPRAMAAALLGWDGEQVAERLRGAHGRSNLPEKVPVYVAYFTAWPDLAGEVSYHEDIYGRDARMREALDAISQSRAAGV